MSASLTPPEYRLLVEHVPVLIWRAGPDGGRDYVNDTWLAFTGRTLAQELGDGWTEGIHADDARRCADEYRAHVERREAFEREYRLRRHDGVYRRILDRGVPYTDEGGAFAGFLGSCVDLEERPGADAARGAFEIDYAQLIGAVAHDIRGPLGVIDGSAQLLVMRAGEDAQLRKLSERIDRGVKRITRIVTDLVDLVRQQHDVDGIPLARASADLHAIATAVVEESRATAADRTIALTCPEPVTGRWDAPRITQALSSVVGDAVKRGAAGQPITVHVSGDATRAAVEVHHAGAIDPERRKRGLGLGLLVARSIAQAHGGELQVDSSPEHGTTFRFVLPRAP